MAESTEGRGASSGVHLFAADLHLDGGEVSRERLRALIRIAHAEGASLHLLGDVFHYWFGPRHLDHPMFHRELELLRGAVAIGVPVLIVPGNRDFLLDAEFSRATGVRLAADATELVVGGERVHLSHGDLFGVADVRYQRMRRLLHAPVVRWLASHLPAAIVGALARRLRRHSEHVVARKDAEVLAPDRPSIAALFTDGVDVVICGHFHQARDERFSPGEGGGRFRVLEPFEDHGYYLRARDGEWSEHRLAAAEEAA